ncbi:sulfite exporter TauE/SafE family protein [Gloeocapsa sp. BRSZ]
MNELEFYSKPLELIQLLHGLTLGLFGFFAGCLAGLSGIGGGILFVPLMVGVGITPVDAVGTSTFAKVMISASGSWQNWRMGSLDLQRVAALGLPALLCAQIGVYFASRLPSYLILSAFGCLLLANVYLIDFRRRISKLPETIASRQQTMTFIFWRAIAGGAAGLLAGLFGVGGGLILLPLQILLLQETMTIAIQTSLGVVFISSISACVGHTLNGNVLFWEGSVLGITGAVGAQLGTRLLHILPIVFANLATRIVVLVAVIYLFWRINFIDCAQTHSSIKELIGLSGTVNIK